MFFALWGVVLWPNTALAADRTISVEHQHRGVQVLIYSITVGDIQVQKTGDGGV